VRLKRKRYAFGCTSSAPSAHIRSISLRVIGRSEMLKAWTLSGTLPRNTRPGWKISISLRETEAPHAQRGEQSRAREVGEARARKKPK
jgi:hypothetical protein